VRPDAIHDKMSRMISPLIRTMRSDDLEFAAQCTAGEGWSTETRQEFEGFLAYDAQGCFIAEWEGRKAGICMAVCYKTKGFIGEMIVRPEFRAKGLGPRLFNQAIGYLQMQGCRSISLDAVPRAASFYESVGFRRIGRSLRFSKRIVQRAASPVRPMGTVEFDRVCSLDRRAFGADRMFFLQRRLMLYPELASTRLEDGEITGYIFGRRTDAQLWAGPWWVADDAEDPAALLVEFGRGLQASEISLGVLENNTRAVTLVRELGFEEKSAASIRMVMGDAEEAPGLSPDLWAIGSAAKG